MLLAINNFTGFLSLTTYINL